MSKVPGQRKLKTKIGLSIAAVSVFIFLVLIFSIPLDDEYSDDVVLSDTLEKRLVKTDQGKIYLVKNNGLSVLEENKLISVWENMMILPKVFWDDDKFYIIYDKSAGEVLLTDIVTLDLAYNELNYHTITKHVVDFAVQDSIAYILTTENLLIMDLESNKEISTVKFEKPGHDIVVKGNYAYVVDDIVSPVYVHIIVSPVYVHIIDISNPLDPLKYTQEYFYVNTHLVTQEIQEDKWYVLVSSSSMSGLVESIVVYGVTPDEFFEKAQYVLVRIPYLENEEPVIEEEWYISDFTINDNLIYTVGRVHNKIKFAIFSMLQEESSEASSVPQLSMLEIDDAEQPSNIILSDDRAYFASQKGVYVIDIEDPLKPKVVSVIKNT